MSDTPENLTLEILRAIRGELVSTNEGMRGLRDEVAGLRGEVATLQGELAGLRSDTSEQFGALRSDLAGLEATTIRGFEGVAQRLDETNARIDGTNTRLDGLRGLAGAGHRDHETRIGDLESRVTRLEQG